MKGFTLLEVLVALSIFALIGLGSNQLLRTVIDIRDATEFRTNQLTELQRAIGLLERDLTQIVSRPIRNEYGDRVPALQIGNGSYDLEFTRLGWRNPTAAPRSNVQRVAYQLKEGELERLYWLVLDRAEDSEPRVQKILANVEDFRVQALSENGVASDQWSGDLATGNLPSDELILDDRSDQSGKALPVAIEIFIQIQGLGEVRKVINLVAEADLRPSENAIGEGADRDKGKDQGLRRGEVEDPDQAKAYGDE